MRISARIVNGPGRNDITLETNAQAHSRAQPEMGRIPGGRQPAGADRAWREIQRSTC
jgi:hypothetical protein